MEETPIKPNDKPAWTAAAAVTLASFLLVHAPFWRARRHPPAPPAPTGADATDALLDEAKKIFPEDPARARALARDAAKRQPYSYQAHLLLAQSLEAQRKTKEAFASYQKAADLYPESYEAHLGAGRTANALGSKPVALQAFKMALSVRPGAAMPLVHIGDILLGQGAGAEAEKAYRQALSVDPSLANAYVGLGVLRFMQGDPAGAEALLLEALRRDPRQVEAHSSLASLYARRKNIPEAKKHFQAAIDLNPRYGPALRDYLHFLRDVGDREFLEAEQQRLSAYLDDKP